METFTICVSSHRKNSQDVEFKVTVNNTATVTEVLLKALELTNLYRKEDQDYALSVEKDARKPLALATKVNSLQTRKLYLTQILFKITVYIMQNQQEQLFGLSPLMTVSEAVQFIEQSNFTGANYNILSDHLKSRTPSHELFLVTTTDQTSTTAKGIPLDFNRTLRSYRVTPLDTLVLSKAQNRNHVWTDIIENEGDKQIAVIVSSDEFSCSKAFKVPITATFQEVLCMFIERTNQVILHRFFTLALDMKGTPGEMMDMENEVGSYPLPTPARLKCVAKPRPAQTVFGVDPTTLPLVNDMGVDVPEIVVILRDMLLLLDPFEQEGIFRKAGNETEMKKMIKDFNAGRPVQSTDIHSVATLLKRWFKDLPKRLFSHIHKSILDDEERLRNIYDELSPMESALTKWLFELLVDISKNSDVNKMIPSNLGIVFGPGVFGSSTFDASSALNAISLLTSDSKTGQEIIEKSISYLLEHPEHRPLKPEKPLKSTIVESSYQSAGATSGAPMPMGLPPVVIDFSSDSKMAQMLARRRQMVEGEIAAPVIEPTKPKKPALGSSFPRQAFALRPTPPATTANETQNNTTGGNARVKSMMLPGGGMNIQNELKNRIAIGQAGLKKFEPRQPPPNPTQQEAGPPGFKRASQPNVGQITRPNFRATPSPPYRESSTNQPQTSENSPTQPSNGEESSTPERKPHKIATVENRPKNVKYPPAPPPRPARARPVSVAPNKMYSRNPSIPSRSVDSKTLFPHLQAAREKPTLTPPSRPLAARPKLVPELPKKPATAPPSRPNRRTLPPKMFKQPNRPPPQAPDSDPLPGSAEEPPHVVSDSPSSTAPVPVPVPAPKPTPDVPKQPEVVEIQVSKPMEPEPEPEPVEEPESVKPEPVKPELQEKIEQLVASMEAEMLQSENSTDAQLRDSIPTGKKPKRAPSLRLLGSNDVVPTAETISQSKRSSGTAKPVFLGEMSSPRSKLDLLLDAADDFLADNSEDDLLNELDAAGSSLDVPPEPKKTICFEDDDDDSDPIKELIDFVESESTPLEKLLGLEAPRNSPVSPRSATNTPEAPLSPQEPQTINNIRPLRNDSTPARPGMSVISPTALPTRTTSTPIHNRTTKNTTDSSSLHTHRRSIFSRKKSEKKLDREPKKPEEEKEKKKKRFGRKKPKTKNQGAPATSALDQPGVTWGKSKDAEAILEKLRSEGMDL